MKFSKTTPYETKVGLAVVLLMVLFAVCMFPLSNYLNSINRGTKTNVIVPQCDFDTITSTPTGNDLKGILDCVTDETTYGFPLWSKRVYEVKARTHSSLPTSVPLKSKQTVVSYRTKAGSTSTERGKYINGILVGTLLVAAGIALIRTYRKHTMVKTNNKNQKKRTTRSKPNPKK